MVTVIILIDGNSYNTIIDGNALPLMTYHQFYNSSFTLGNRDGTCRQCNVDNQLSTCRQYA